MYKRQPADGFPNYSGFLDSGESEKKTKKRRAMRRLRKCLEPKYDRAETPLRPPKTVLTHTAAARGPQSISEKGTTARQIYFAVLTVRIEGFDKLNHRNFIAKVFQKFRTIAHFFSFRYVGMSNTRMYRAPGIRIERVLPPVPWHPRAFFLTLLCTKRKVSTYRISTSYRFDLSFIGI